MASKISMRVTRRNDKGKTKGRGKGNVRLSDESETEEAETNPLVRRHNNIVYFFTDLSEENVLDLYEKLEEAREYCILNRIKELYIHIQSEGGCMFSGLNAMEYISNIEDVKVVGVVCGCAASASTLLLMGCSYVKMYEYSFVQIHQLSTSFDFGKFSELRDELKNTEKFNNSLRSVYKKYTSIDDKKLDELFSKDIYLNAAECIEYGIIDEIM